VTHRAPSPDFISGRFIVTEIERAPGRRKAYSLREVGGLINTGQTKLFELIKSGKLKSRKLGRKRLVLDTDLEQFLETLPNQ
jgi:excisionase family DNA binding protein